MCEHTDDNVIEYVDCGLIYVAESELKVNKDTHQNILFNLCSYKSDITDNLAIHIKVDYVIPLIQLSNQQYAAININAVYMLKL